MSVLDGINDEIGKIWVVINPTKDSVIYDILYETRISSLMTQAKGGLDPDEIMMITKDQKTAKAYAQKLLKEKSDKG